MTAEAAPRPARDAGLILPDPIVAGAGGLHLRLGRHAVPMPISPLYRDPDDAGLHAIDRARLEAAPAVDWQDRLPDALCLGRLDWPSPVDGAPLSAQGCLCLDDFHFAYRFADLRHGLVFFVVIANHCSRVGGIWFPRLGLMVAGPQERTSGVATIQVLPHLAHWIVTHVCAYAALLVPYLQRAASGFASVMRGRCGLHLGHQLWNELSGIDRLLSAHAGLAQAGRLPEWIVLDAADTTYETGAMALRVTAEHVSAGPRGRVLERLQGGASKATVRATGAGRRPVLLLGLRVENRTCVDPAGLLERLIGFIAGRFEDALFVLDGHNARGDDEADGIIHSHGEGRGTPPVEVERELAERARARLGAHGARVIDTTGQPLAVSLAWAERCDGFVSVWGASLAKYRWVCNKPGLVMTSRHDLAHRDDLHIYDDPACMDTPAPLAFIDPELVRDRPEVRLLVDPSPGQAWFRNFEVDETRLFPAIARMIEDSLDRPAAPERD